MCLCDEVRGQRLHGTSKLSTQCDGWLRPASLLARALSTDLPSQYMGRAFDGTQCYHLCGFEWSISVVLSKPPVSCVVFFFLHVRHGLQTTP